MEVVLAGRSTVKSRGVIFQVMWLVKQLKLQNHNGTIEIIPKRGLAKRTGGVGLAGSNGSRIGFAYDTKLDEIELIRTVCHEMIHVKQLVKGQLKYAVNGDKEIVEWLGKPFDTSKVKYIDRPWEREAYSKQEILRLQFNDFLSELIRLAKEDGRSTEI